MFGLCQLAGAWLEQEAGNFECCWSSPSLWMCCSQSFAPEGSKKSCGCFLLPESARMSRSCAAQLTPAMAEELCSGSC